MWQQLVNEVGPVWITLSLLLSVAVLAFCLVLWWLLRKNSLALLKRLDGLRSDVQTLPGFHIENMDKVQVIFGDRGGALVKESLLEMTKDSKSHFSGFWTPDPADRLSFSMLSGLNNPWLQKSACSLPFLVSLMISFVAFGSALALSSVAFANDWMRFLALLPLLIGGLGFLVLQQIRKDKLALLQESWNLLIVQLQRKLPVYNQAAETAGLLQTFVDYDRQMTKAVRQLSSRVDALASNELTEAVAVAVQYVMAASVAPPIQKSTDALSLLATQLEKKLMAGENQLQKLYIELANRQEEQAKIWHSRYEELASSLKDEQHNALSTLVDNNSVNWHNLRDKLSTVLNELASGQKALQADLLTDQKTSFAALVSENTAALDQIKNQYLASVSQQAEQQENALAEMQERIFSASGQITEVVADLAQVQKEGQAEAMAEIAGQLTDSLSGMASRQEESFTALKAEWNQALNQLSTEVVSGLGKMDQGQQEALAAFSKTHLTAVNSLAEQQSSGVRELLGQFSGQVSDILADYLDPVTARLQTAAEVLINSQSYASDIQATLARQKEQTAMLEESIRDVLGQFVETRQHMLADIASLEQSTKVMSESAATMSAIYSGSQTGLNDAISRMSDEMLSLSDALKEVVAGSAEQARQVQLQATESYELNQQQLNTIREQVDILTNDLSTRIDQLMIGFTNLTEDLVGNVQKSIDSQNSQLGSGLKSLTDTMAEEARSISLYAQQINMDISGLNSNLGTAVTDFASSIDLQLNNVLSRFDQETADILRRLAVAAAEIGDAVEILPDVLRVRLLEKEKDQA